MKPLMIGLLLLVVGCGSGTEAEYEGRVGLQTAPVAAAPSENVILGTVVGVTDGDTVTVLDGNKTTHKVRLKHIDAPERRQDFGTQAKKYLSSQVFNKSVRVHWSEKDRYQRTLGDIFVGDQWINKDMVSSGFAWHYRQYSDDAQVAAAERRARDQKVGLWSHADAIAPWDFRRGVRPAVAAASTSPLERTQTATVFVTRTGKKYHRSGCRHLRKSRISIPLNKAMGTYGACSACRPPN